MAFRKYVALRLDLSSRLLRNSPPTFRKKGDGRGRLIIGSLYLEPEVEHPFSILRNLVSPRFAVTVDTVNKETGTPATELQRSRALTIISCSGSVSNRTIPYRIKTIPCGRYIPWSLSVR